MVTLSDSLQNIVGAKAAVPLQEVFGIRTVDDLLRHYPRSYTEGAALRGADDEPPEKGQHITVVDTITQVVERPMKKRPHEKFLLVTVGSGRGKVTATFFNPRYLKKGLTQGTRVMLSGEVSFYRDVVQLTHPAFLILDTADGKTRGTSSLRSIADASQAVNGEVLFSEFQRRCYPIYPASTTVQSWDIFACVRQVLEVLDPVPDPLPAALRAQRGLITEDEALRAIHLAEDESQRRHARERLTFDEAVGLQWALVHRRHGERAESGLPAPLPRPDGLVAGLLRRLPFELTSGQRDVLDVLSAELAATRPMNRLLQGEVGSGKTIVAVLAMLQMVDAGYQCALLAPTEVLAGQHFESISAVLGPLGLGGQLGGVDDATQVMVLTGSMTAAQKKHVRAEIISGRAGIIIGTHALLHDAVEFHRLGLVVIDEQHRFGVEQRDRLRAKAPAGRTPHLLVMTATPIPRTVALTVYGDLETSTLRELPRGRQPITTNTIFVKEKPGWLHRAWQRIIEEVAQGRQAYVVAPRIDDAESGADDGARPSATAEYLFARLSTHELAGLRLGLMHGRLSGDQKDAVMSAFRAGDLDVLVSTTVIEVGVDVPNATIMVVMDADRFGVSQLHQLRGRIGRGAHPSLCLLASWVAPTSPAARRLRAVAETVDGFALADLDLAERKEGDVLGRNQSGRSLSLRLLSLADHREVIEAARDFCAQAYRDDPNRHGLAQLAARFTATDRVEFLDKA
ncbi:MAG: ATP-dependent DNA helicase RecG [Mycobacteriaceae bacterium]|nr:ATP-dependent DNA helicase RecG [Mycobacteriaceae bacterium]